MYKDDIPYVGHEEFMKILGYIEQNRYNIDLTEKRLQIVVEGKIVKQRKLQSKTN